MFVFFHFLLLLNALDFVSGSLEKMDELSVESQQEDPQAATSQAEREETGRKLGGSLVIALCFPPVCFLLLFGSLCCYAYYPF